MTSLLQPRRAWALALLCLVLGGLCIGLLGTAERSQQPTDSLPAGAQSTVVTELTGRFPAGDDSTAIVLFAASGEQRVVDELGSLQAAFDDAVREAGAEPSGPGRLVPSKDGTAALGVVSVPGAGAAELADAVEELRTGLARRAGDGVTAQVTGPAAIQADLAAVFEGADFRLLGATAAVVAVLLVITYRSPLLWLVPLLVVGTADRAAASVATHVLASLDVAYDESTTGILSVLVFGAGTDYALLLISRYRDELRMEEDRYVAMRRALRRTTEAVLASAATVVVGLLVLLLSVVPTTRGLGLACALGVVIAALAVLVALPPTLVLFGRWVFWPRTPRVGQPTLVESGSLWRRVGDAVSRRPLTLAVVTLVTLAALASGAAQIRTGLSQADQFLDAPEAVTASERLAQSFPAGSADPTQVVTGDDVGTVTAAVEAVDGVTSVRPSGQADGLTRLDVVLEAPPGTEDARASVVALRAALADAAATDVGGTEAAALDERDAAARDRLLLVPLILALVLLSLGLLLRSVVAPLVLVASVVATYVAALGASWWLFTGILGFDRLDSGVPLLAFLFLVALGVDYNIFLVTRAGEEAREHGARAGMLRALTATGGVITSAGIVLAAVFAVLGVLPLVVLAQLGVVICVGVLLDTLVVRTVLVPAIAVRLGERFWWPRSP